MALGCAAALQAHADSISDHIKFEAGVGFGVAKDMGDGVWVQDGAPDNREKLTFPALLAGFTGPVCASGPWDVRRHLGATPTSASSALRSWACPMISTTPRRTRS